MTARGERGAFGVARQLLDQHDHGFPDRPAAAAGPGGGVESEPVPERLAALAREEGPRDRRVAGRIADAGAAEVDHGTEPTVADEQVSRLRVAVEPHRRRRFVRGQGRLPHPRRETGVDVIAQRGQGRPGLAVVDRDRPAAMEVVRAGLGTASRIQPVQRARGTRPGPRRTAAGWRCCPPSRARRRSTGTPTTAAGTRSRARPARAAAEWAAVAAARARAASGAPCRAARRSSPRSAAGPTSSPPAGTWCCPRRRRLPS